MAIEVELSTGALQIKIAALEQRIIGAEYDMARTLIAWQRDDMKRTYPFLRDVSPFSVSTVIWPRSRTWKKGSGGGRARPRRRVTRVRRAPGAPPRPILRPVLFEMLKARISTLCQEIWKWP